MSNEPAINQFSFRPRARIMRTLGQELISNETVALIELVKNAYDADATRVLIRFSDKLEKGQGYIEVIDNGHGMSLAVIKTAWMEPATNSKRKRTRSEGFRRRLLGEKGIGRFASSRLANELELITKVSSDSSEIYALFDWTQFDREDIYLDEVEILAEERQPQEICPNGVIEDLWKTEFWGKTEQDIKKELNHGTILRMNRLNQHWGKPEFIDLQRGLSRLVSPFTQHSNFRIRLELPNEFSDFSHEVTPPEIIKHPHYSIKGNVGTDGSYKFNLSVTASGLNKTIEGCFLWGENKGKEELLMLSNDQASELIVGLTPEERAERTIQTGALDLELRIWDRDELGHIVQTTGTTLQNVRKDLDAIAGVNIYRDSFRVLPYGEPNDDWLRLDIRRVQRPTRNLSNNQIVGYINITADTNPNLKDQSNREGLDDSRAKDELRKIIIASLSTIETIRYSLRPKQEKRSVSTPVTGLFTAVNLDDIRARVADRFPHDQEIQKLLDDTQKRIEEQIDEIQVVIARYQNLATLGTLIDVVLHDGRHPLSTIIQQAILGQDDIDSANPIITDKQFFSGLDSRFHKIEQQGNALQTVFRRIEPFAGRRRGRPSQLYLEEIIKDAVGVLQSEIDRLSIKLCLPDTQTLVRIDPAEIQQVIINLLNNSLYWLQSVEKRKRNIDIKVKRIAEDHVEIIFKDSGPGVPPEYRDSIFEPYFSTKPDGVGLGLAISGEIISDYYGGKLELIDSNPGKGAVFRITLKRRI